MSLFSDPTRILVPTIKLTKKDKSSISLPYDPESLDISFQNCVHEDKSMSASSGAIHFAAEKSSALKVTFILDDTTFSNLVAYVLPKSRISDSVDNSIKVLQGISNEHEKVNIQALNMPLMGSPSGSFNGLLTSMKVKTELVDSFGNRVKAKVECSFTHSMTEAERKKSSSGVPMSNSKAMLIKVGAKLAAIAFSQLGSVALAAPLAAANGMNSVRKSKPGSTLVVPAADKIKKAASDVVN